MTLDNLNKYYGTDAEAGRALGYTSKGTVSAWRRNGGIPFEAQCRYEKLTNRKLKANREHDPANCFYKPIAA